MIFNIDIENSRALLPPFNNVQSVNNAYFTPIINKRINWHQGYVQTGTHGYRDVDGGSGEFVQRDGDDGGQKED